MSFGNIKYKTGFKTRMNEDVSIYIYEKGYAGADVSTLTLYAPGCVLTQSEKEMFEPVKGRGCTLYVKEPRKLDYDFFYNNPTNTHKIKIFKDGFLNNIFEGFIVPSVYTSSLSPNDRQIEIVCSDNLGSTKNYIPTYDGAKSLIHIIDDVLWSTGLEYDYIYVNSSLFENSMDPSGKTFLDQTFLENDALLKNNKDFKNGHQLLTDILKPFNAFVYSNNGSWRIERFNDYFITEDTSVRWIRYWNQGRTGIFTKVVSYSNKNKIDITTNYTTYADAQELTKTTPVAKFKLQRSIDEKTNLVDTSNLPAITSTLYAPLSPDYLEWMKNDSITIYEYNADSDVLKYGRDYATMYDMDHIATVTRTTFDIDSSGSKDSCDSIKVEADVKGYYSRYVSDKGKGYWPVVVRIFNDAYPTGRFLYQNGENIASSGSTQYFYIEHSYTLSDDKLSLTNFDYQNLSVTVNLYDVKQYLQKHNWIEIGFGPVRDRAGVVTDFQNDTHIFNYVKNLKVTYNTNYDRTNLIQGDVSIGYQEVYEDDIEYGDLNNFNFKNGFGLDGGAENKTQIWHDRTDSSLNIEEKYILERLQQYNKHRYTLNVEAKDVSVWKKDSIFTYSLLDPSILFFNKGYSHDLYNSEASFILEEYKNNDNLFK